MVTSTNLPSEAFRSVHRMFFVPHTCNDPTNILQHADFLNLFTSMSKSKHHVDANGGGHAVAEKREHEKDESNEYGNIEMITVGDVKERQLARAIKTIEEEMNKEIRFMVLTEKEFGNRLDVRDKLVYGLFERPHEIWFSKTKIALPRL